MTYPLMPEAPMTDLDNALEPPADPEDSGVLKFPSADEREEILEELAAQLPQIPDRYPILRKTEQGMIRSAGKEINKLMDRAGEINDAAVRMICEDNGIALGEGDLGHFESDPESGNITMVIARKPLPRKE